MGARESPQKSRPEPGNGEKNSRAWLGEKSGRRTGKSLKQRAMPHHRRQREGLTFSRFSCKKTGLKLFRGKIENSGHHAHSRNMRIAMVKGGGLAYLSNALRKAPALDGEKEAAAAKYDPEEEDARREKRILMRGQGRPPSLFRHFCGAQTSNEKKWIKTEKMQKENPDEKEVQATEFFWLSPLR